MNSSSDEIEGPQWILTHSPKMGTVAFRHGRWKLIPEIKEFYNIEDDPEEKNNLFYDGDCQDKLAHFSTWLENILERIEIREEKQNYGQKNICPQ